MGCSVDSSLMKWAPNPYVLAERLSGKLLAAGEARAPINLMISCKRHSSVEGKDCQRSVRGISANRGVVRATRKLRPRPSHRSTDISGSGLHDRTSHTGAA